MFKETLFVVMMLGFASVVQAEVKVELNIGVFNPNISEDQKYLEIDRIGTKPVDFGLARLNSDRARRLSVRITNQSANDTSVALTVPPGVTASVSNFPLKSSESKVVDLILDLATAREVSGQVQFSSKETNGPVQIKKFSVKGTVQ